MKQVLLIVTVLFCVFSCRKIEKHLNEVVEEKPVFDTIYAKPLLNDKMATYLYHFAYECIDKEYPNKLGQVLGDSTYLKEPSELHPAFYGCFDWHSSVHGHWTLLNIIKELPNFEQRDSILKKLQTTITKENILIEIAYFDQLREALDLESSLEDFISPGSEWVEIGGQRKHVKSYLNDFLFSPERARSPVKTLSGGERNRLLLARLFAKPANVLVLDEPTNDLDIDTLDLLEEFLQNYGGTVFLVSHDRQFLDHVVTSMIAFEGAGTWREYEGGYEDWKIQNQRRLAHQRCLQLYTGSHYL